MFKNLKALLDGVLLEEAYRLKSTWSLVLRGAMQVRILSSNNGNPECQRCYEDRLATARRLERRRMSYITNYLEEGVRTSRNKGTSRRETGPQGQENLEEQAGSCKGDLLVEWGSRDLSRRRR